jgi:antagonist of KipI
MTVAFRVEKSGVFVTLQDLGRPHHRSSGVSVGGAMDRFALIAANRLVGNDSGAGCLEIVLSGLSLVAETRCLIAITGGDLEPKINGQPAPDWTSIQVARGDSLTFGSRRHGARAYLAVAGGFDGQRWLGSVSTYLLIGRGGICGRALKVGDALSLAAQPAKPLVSGRHLAQAWRPAYSNSNSTDLAVVPGPQFNRVAPGSRKLFFDQEYEISRDSDRLGYRLAGDHLEIRGPELLSFGLTFGCVQLPPSGQPILLMADHQTAGGYPVVACVPRSDLPLAAQLLPGDKLRFRRSSVEASQQRWRELMSGLQALG